MTDEPLTRREGGGDLADPDKADAPGSVEPDAIRALVARLSRPHGSGSAVIERAAILAAGSDATAILAWIIANGGRAEEQPDEADSSGGVHRGGRSTASAARRHPRRYVLPVGCL